LEVHALALKEAEGRGRILGRFARLHQAQHQVRHPHGEG
jgi:hypothetical protein